MPVSTASCLPRPCRPALAAVLAGLLALGAVAAPLQGGDTPLQQADAGIAPTLDRALSVDTSTSQRNLELLLETRAAGEGPGTAATRRPPTQPAQAPAATALATQANGLSGAAPADVPSATAAQRDWLGASPAGASDHPGLLGAPVTQVGSTDYGMHGAASLDRDEIDPALRGAFVKDIIAFLRDNRLWLLGAMGLAALVAVGVQLWLRRAAGEPTRRQAELAALAARRNNPHLHQHGSEHGGEHTSSPRTRRRTSSRGSARSGSSSRGASTRGSSSRG